MAATVASRVSRRSDLPEGAAAGYRGGFGVAGISPCSKKRDQWRNCLSYQCFKTATEFR